jgi:hypothetical protein
VLIFSGGTEASAADHAAKAESSMVLKAVVLTMQEMSKSWAKAPADLDDRVD